MENITLKQKKLIKLIMENYGSKGATKPLKDLLLEAGYTSASAKNPKIILDSKNITESDELNNFIKSLSDKRKLAITYLTSRKLSKAPAREIAYVIDVLTKNTQLLSGKETGKENITFTWEK